jgi:hypothetical protein
MLSKPHKEFFDAVLHRLKTLVVIDRQYDPR